MVRTRLFLACLAPLLLGQQCIGPTTSDNEGAALPPPPARVENPRVTLNTPQGTIVVELFAGQAPETPRIFLQNVRDKYFDDTIIHWAKADEGIRGGRYRADLTAKSVSTTIPNESGNQVPNRRRYLAMVDSSASGTTSAEFVIYTKDSKQYDYVAGDTPQTGRTVFGRVVDGMGVVDAIAALKTKTATAKNGTSLPNMPTETVAVTATQTTGENPPRRRPLRSRARRTSRSRRRATGLSCRLAWRRRRTRKETRCRSPTTRRRTGSSSVPLR